jgi:uncharacterized integral membrane protein
VKDDDLDLDLDDEPVVSERRPAVAAPKTAPAKPSPQDQAAPAKPQAPVASTGERKGWLRGMGDSVDRVRGFKWNVRSFLTVLAALVVLVILIENWVPVRFYALGFAFEMPRTVTFVIDLVIGALLVWLWMRRPTHHAEGDQ